MAEDNILVPLSDPPAIEQLVDVKVNLASFARMSIPFIQIYVLPECFVNEKYRHPDGRITLVIDKDGIYSLGDKGAFREKITRFYDTEYTLNLIAHQYYYEAMWHCHEAYITHLE